MTIDELSKYHNTQLELLQLKEKIQELEETIIGSSKITGMPVNTTNKSNPTARIGTKLADLSTKYKMKQELLIDEMNKIEDFLSEIDDSDVRIIIRKRFLDGKTWTKISKEIHCDRSTPYYRLKKYLEEGVE